MKNSVPYLFIPERDAEFIKKDFQMQEIIDLLNKHKEILELTADGQTTIEAGKKMFLSGRTVENHITKMMNETGAKNKTQLIAIAFRLKIIE